MRIERVSLRNFRSFPHAAFDMHDYTLLVGANNSGKSTLINALRIFYDDLKYVADDWPCIGADGDEAWIEIVFRLSEDEAVELPHKYLLEGDRLRVRKYLKSSERVKANQSNIYAYLDDGSIDTALFFGAKNISQAKLGSIVYVPALSVPNDHLKTSGPSPLRSIFSYILKRMVSSSPAYERVQEAFAQLNDEARAKGGMLAELANPMNRAIADWGISLQLDVRSVSADDFAKTLIQHSFSDPTLGDGSMPLERFGHGFQRTVIYELIKLAPRFQDRTSETRKKDFSPDFTLVLFEEPEAFLHPDQQINMALSLRRLGQAEGQQVLVTTHSPIFVGKSSGELTQIVRISKTAGISQVHQLTEKQLDDLFGEGQRLGKVLADYVNDPNVPENKKPRARQMLLNMPADAIAEAEERFRFQLWLDSDRSSIFFANKVIVCEGPSEKALFNYLLENDWFDLRPERISVLDALGKFNIHRYLALLDAFAIPHAVVTDGDNDDAHHAVINDLIKDMCGKHSLCEPFRFPDDIEAYLDLPKPPGNRKDLKPVSILRAASAGTITAERLQQLRSEFVRTCGVKAEPQLEAAQ